MKKNLFAKTLKTVAEKGVKIGINRKCVAVYHEIDAPEKAKKFRNKQGRFGSKFSRSRICFFNRLSNQKRACSRRGQAHI